MQKCKKNAKKCKFFVDFYFLFWYITSAQRKKSANDL